MEQLANNIRFYRNKCKWTQEVLAEKLTLSRSVITKWENNQAVPDAVMLGRLSDLFQVPTDYLIGNTLHHQHLLKDVKTLYKLDETQIDEEFMEVVDFLMTNPHFKDNFSSLKKMSIKKQHSVQRIFNKIIQEFNQL